MTKAVLDASLLNINGAWDRIPARPRIYNIQHSGENAGTIKTVEGDYKDMITFTLMAQSRMRIMFPQVYQPGNRFLCRSMKNDVPDGIGERPQKGPCNICPYSQWKQEGNKNVRQCDEVWKLLCWDVEDNKPFLFFIKGTAVPALAHLQSLIQLDSYKFAADDISAHLCVEFEMTLDEQEFGNNTYYVPVFSLKGGNTPELREDIKQFLTGGGLPLLLTATEQEPQRQLEAPPQDYQSSYRPPTVAAWPDISTEPKWYERKIGSYTNWKNFMDVSFLDLMLDKPVPDRGEGKKVGLALLRALMHVKDNPKIIELAKEANRIRDRVLVEYYNPESKVLGDQPQGYDDYHDDEEDEPPF